MDARVKPEHDEGEVRVLVDGLVNQPVFADHRTAAGMQAGNVDRQEAD